ncbi:uncharacterized protein FOMMEDRAFT_30390 [Fomitiporia mediterranea MF3/22]|uniref:uncharacterized protein n=1 Tax=Fomitiporia mediterranea (strain MF3/22) TaxID=694068 RepID=UPI000440933D|nr:uncharacterized protein FOMMEDRAFT_30390 [Fomitiporia mediterranea MF3/22]EJD00306.1 hypothetical protein FOMMEDRAFT_30390 [Fomitiporia mediterranea MF3/22]
MDDTDIEYKPLEAVRVGEIIVGPTPGLRTVNEKIGFLWSAIPGGHHGDTFHKQIVVGRDNARGRLRTVMITSLGKTYIGKSISDRYDDIPDQKKQEITREEWMKNIRYFVPLEPTELETDPTHMYEQPQVKVQYKRGHDILKFAHWAFVAKKFAVGPLDWKGHLGDGKFAVKKDIMIHGKSIEKLNQLVNSRQQELDPTETGRAFLAVEQTTSEDRTQSTIDVGTNTSAARRDSAKDAQDKAVDGQIGRETLKVLGGEVVTTKESYNNVLPNFLSNDNE